MSVDTEQWLRSSTTAPMVSQADDDFAERRRIALMEPDRALRSVLVRLLLRLGCIVSFKPDPQAVVEALQEGYLDGAIVALEAGSPLLAELHAANAICHVPLVVLSNEPAGLWEARNFANLRFLEKPFDARELCALLGLPAKAKLSSDV